MELTQIDPYYDVGTATMSTSSRTMTGQGTLWANLIVPGDPVYGADGRMGGIVESVNSNTSITLVKNWRGANQTAGVYTIHRISDSVRVEQFSQRLLNLLLGGRITAFSELAGAANKIPYFNGENSLATADFPAWARSMLSQPGAADRIPYLTGANGAALTTLTSFARSLLDDANADAARATLGIAYESGFTASGGYVRYADGTQICWGNTGTVAQVLSGIPGLFSHSFDQASSGFPAAFSEPPMVSARIQSAGAENPGNTVAAVEGGPNATTRFSTGRIRGAMNIPVASAYYIWSAIGRWL